MTDGVRTWVEFRVHGVSGTPATEMLAAPHVVQVAGDSGRKVFRRADCLGVAVPGDPDGRVLEAYHWGDLTSGRPRQALWLLLVPFGIVNAAQFMLPPPAVDGEPASRTALVWHALCGALLRLVALALTALLSLTVAVICMDLLAWRKADTVEWLDGVAGGTVAVAGMVATLAVALVFYLLGGRLQDVEPPPPSRTASALMPTTALARPAFYGGDPNSPDLRRLHLATGVGVVALLACAPLDSGGSAVVTVSRATAVAVLVALAVVALVMGDPGGSASLTPRSQARRTSVTRRNGAVKVVVLALLAIVWLLVIVSAALLWGTRRGRSGQPLPGSVEFASVLGFTVTASLCLLLLANLGLAVSTGLTRRTDDPFRPFARGLAASLATAVGVFVALGFSAGGTIATSRLLGVPGDEVAPLLSRVTHAWGWTAVLTLLGAGWVIGSFFLRLRSLESRTAAAYDIDPGASSAAATRRPKHTQRVRKQISRAACASRLKTLIEPIFWGYAVLGLVLAVLAGAEDAWGDLPGALGRLSDTGDEAPLATTLSWLGTTVLVGLAGGLLLVGRSAVREKTRRRGANVVWDVISFWPHSTHPFVPVPYAQLVVPDVVRHVRRHLDRVAAPTDDSCDVVLAAHSQGSLIATAALVWLEPDELRRIGFVTFGSQLRLGFARAFPHYVNGALIRQLAVGDLAVGRPRRWVNLYRETDAIAGPVLSWRHRFHHVRTTPGRPEWESRSCTFSAGADAADVVDPVTGRRRCGLAGAETQDAEEWRLLDPPLPVPGGPLLDTTIRGHGEYFADVDWVAAIRHVRGVQT